MKKQKIQLILVAIVLILCVAGYFIIKNMNLQDESTENAEAQTNVTSVTQEDVTQIEYTYLGETIDLIKDGDTWYDHADRSLTLSQSDITSMLSYVCNISTATLISDPESLDTYGLANPSNTISLTLADDSVVQVMIGDYLDITGEYYAMVPGDSNVYTIQSYVVTAFEKSVEDLLDTSETEKEE